MTSDFANAVVAVSALVSAATTVVLAVLTFRYVRMTGRMVTEMREVREPSVFLDIEVDDDTLVMLIGNRGVSAAFGIAVELRSELPWLEMDGARLMQLPLIRDGLDYLAPGRELKYLAGRIDWQRATSSGGRVDAALSFRNESGRVFDRRITIDLSKYNGVAISSFRSPGAVIAESLSDMSRRQQMRDVAGRTGPRKFCPACAKSIPMAARKCFRCGESLAPNTAPVPSAPPDGGA